MERTRSVGALFAELGRALCENGRYPEAEEMLRKALEEKAADFSYAQVWLSLRDTYKAMNKPDDALRALSKAVSLDPSLFEQAKEELLSRSVLPSLSLPQSQVGWGGVLKKVMDRFSPKRGLVRDLAADLIRKGKFSNAEMVLTFFTRAWPDDAEAFEALGLTLLKQAKLLESIIASKRAIDLDQDRTGAYANLGQAYLGLKQHQLAVEACDEVLKRQPDNVEVLVARGVARRGTADLEGSEQDLKRAVEIDGENERACRELAATQSERGNKTGSAENLSRAAGLLIRRGDLLEAERVSAEAVHLDPENRLALLHHGRALVGQQRYSEALKSLTLAAEIATDLDVQLEIARVRLASGDSEGALQATEMALHLKAASPAALALRGTILHKLKRYDEALASLRECLDANPSQPDVLTEIGEIFEETGERDQALQSYERALNTDPGNASARRSYALLLTQDRQYDRALPELEAALRLRSDDEALQMARGEALYYLNRFEEAVSSFEDGLRKKPNDPAVLRLRGSALRKLGRFDEAVASLQLAIDLESSRQARDGFAYSELGEALRRLNRHREAATAFRKALVIERKQWTLARYGETLRLIGENEEAREILEEACSQDPTDAWALSSLAAVLLDLEYYRSALDKLEQALRINSKDGWSWAYKGMLLRLNSRYAAALESYDRAAKENVQTSWVDMEKAAALAAMGGESLQKALIILQDVTRVETKNALALTQLGACLYQTGKANEALQAAKTALAIDAAVPGAEALKDYLVLLASSAPPESSPRLPDAEAYLVRARQYANILRLYAPAVRDFEKAIELMPGNPEPYNELAWIHAINGQPKEALKPAEKSVELAAQQGRNDFFMGKVKDTLGWSLFMAGDYAAALPIIEEASRLNSEDLEIEDHVAACRQKLTAAATASSKAGP